jgi:uncharacterized protein YmfQ (DUF2313 family)
MTVFSDTVNEAASATDIPRTTWITGPIVAESASAADAPVTTWNTSAFVSELGYGFDAPAETWSTSASVAEAASAADSPSHAVPCVLSESGAAADLASAVQITASILSEVGAAAESSSVTLAASPLISEDASATTTDAFAGIGGQSLAALVEPAGAVDASNSLGGQELADIEESASAWDSSSAIVTLTPRRVIRAPPADRHVRRSGADYLAAFLSLLPTGPAWPRDLASTMVLTWRGLVEYYGFVDGRAADLLERESDPRITVELLPDWERNWGLPDPCFPSATTIAERQKMLVLAMTWMGGSSRAYFEKLMAWLGYGAITIGEWAPFMAGISRVGDTRPAPDEHFRWYIGPPEMRFYWSVAMGKPSLIWFRASSGQAGVDHHLKFGLIDDMQCLLNRWKPAHTALVYDVAYAALGPMDGTP